MSELNSDYIDPYQMTAEAYAGLSDDEQQAVNEVYIQALKEKGKSDAEIEEALAELKTSLEEIAESYENYADELEELQRGKDLSDAEERDIQELIDTCNEIIEEVEEAEDQVDDGYDNYTRHNRSFGSQEDASINELTLDGQTYVYEMNGGNVFINTDSDYQWTLVSADATSGTYVFKVTDSDGNYATVEFQTNNTTDLFANGEKTDGDYLLEERIINEKGEVISDVNGDGFMNEDDIETALEAQKTDPLLDNDTQFFFSSGLKSEHLETLKATWPEELLKICYWGDSTTSFYDELIGSEEADQVDQLAVIDGYEDARSAFDAVVSSYDLSASASEEGGISASESDFKSVYEEAVDLLYGYLDDPTQDINDIWQEIYQICAAKGFSNTDMSYIMQTLVLGLATSDPDHIAQLIPASAVSTIENYLLASQEADDNRLTQMDKVVIMILEDLCAPGMYADLWSGGYFSDDGSADGTWPNNTENVAALETYNLIRSQAGLGISASATTAIETENNRTESQKKEKKSGGTISADDFSYNELISSISGYDYFAHTGNFANPDGITKKKLAEHLTTLVNGINALLEDGSATVQEITDYILRALNGMKAKHRDNVAAALSYLLNDHAHSLFKSLLKNSDFKKGMKGIINNGGNKPTSSAKMRKKFEDWYDIENWEDSVFT